VIAARATTEELAAAIRHVPMLPHVAVELVRAMSDANKRMDDLAADLTRDPGLCIKVLRLANSPFYGLQSRVASVRDAMAILGLRLVRSLVMAAAVGGALESYVRDPGLQTIWRHAFATAHCARAVAARCAVDVETAFTAGLMHDLGRLLMIALRPDAYAEAMRAGSDLRLHRIEAESSLLGLDHAEAGFVLAEHWRLPRAVTSAVRHHHRPSVLDDLTAADVVHVADLVVHTLDLEPTQDEAVPPIDEVAWQRVGLAGESLAKLLRLAEASWFDESIVGPA